MNSPEEVYEKFMDFCSISLKGENPKFLDLIKSRYEGCDDDFRTSDKMVKLLESTQRDMSNEDTRKFVHLKDLLTELKMNASVKKKKSARKRKHSTNSEKETEPTEKVPKLKDCSIVVDSFPSHNTSLLDQNINKMEGNDIPQFYLRKVCSISDGSFDSACSIMVASVDQVEHLIKEHNLGTSLQYISGSPMWNLESSSNGRVDSSSKNILTNFKEEIPDSSSSSLHTLDVNKGRSHRKSVSIVGVEDIAEDCCIRTGTLVDNSVCDLPINDSSNNKESTNCKDDSVNCKINDADVKPPTIESPRKKSTSIVNVEMSNSQDVLIIEMSPPYKRNLKGFSTAMEDRISSSELHCVHRNLAESPILTIEDSPRLDNINCVPSVAKTNDLNALSSTNRGDINPHILSEEPLIPQPLLDPHKILVPCIDICDSTNVVTSAESDETITNKNKSNDANHSSLIEEQVVKKQDLVYGDSTFKSTAYAKLSKRVPLLSITKVDTSNSSSIFGVKSHSHDNQENTSQETKSLTTGCKVISSLMEDKTLASGASDDEFQKGKEQNISTEKKQRHINKLEKLLGSLRSEIEKCQETEMSLEDLDDERAAYIYEDKLKRKFVAVWNKLCEVTERSVTTGRPTERTIRYSGTRYREINRRIERFLNKKKVFPDFHDVQNIVKLTNKKCKLNLSSNMINDVAREAFVDIGEMLQTRRHQDFIATFGTSQTDAIRNSSDPYLTDPELRRKVDSNRQLARLNLDNVIAKYTQLQYDRNCGEDDDEEKEEDTADRKERRESSEESDDSDEAASKDVEEFVTSASIEVDMADEGEDSVGDDDSSKSQQPVTKNSTDLKLGRSKYLLTPKKNKFTFKKPVNKLAEDEWKSPHFPSDGDLALVISTADDESSRPHESIIVIDESPAKSQVEPWKDISYKGSCSFNVQENRENMLELKETSQDLKDVKIMEKKGPNIKYTSRKPFPEIESVQNIKSKTCLEEVPECDDSKKIVSYENKTNAEVENLDDEDDDQSSDSSSDKDADDKSVDDDVEEIVMIINRSESECDTASSRGPSPISVVSLSSDSLSDDDDIHEEKIPSVLTCTDDDDIHNEAKIPSVLTRTDDKKITACLTTPTRYWKILDDSDSLEKRLYLHSIGMHERDVEVSSSANSTGENEMGKEDDPVVGDAADANTASSHSLAMCSSKSVAIEQEQLTAEEDCFIDQSSCMSPNKEINTGNHAVLLKETSEVVEKVGIDQTKMFEHERFDLLEEGSNCAGKIQDSTEKISKNKTSHETSPLHVQNMVKDSATRTSSETNARKVGSTSYQKISVKDSTETFTNDTESNSLPKKSGHATVSSSPETLFASKLKNEETLEQSNNAAENSKLNNYSSSDVNKDPSKNYEMPNTNIELTTEGEVVTNPLDAGVPSIDAGHHVHKSCQDMAGLICETLAASNEEITHPTKTVPTCYLDEDLPTIDSAESLNKQVNRTENEVVIILDDNSIDQLYSQDSSLFQTDLPLHQEQNYNVEKPNVHNAKEVTKDCKLQFSVNLSCDENVDSCQEAANKNVCRQHKDVNQSPPVVLLSENCVIIDHPQEVLDNVAVGNSVETDVNLEHSESHQLFPKSNVTDIKNVDKLSSSKSEDLVESGSEIIEVVSEVPEDITSDNHESSQKHVVDLCDEDNTTANCSVQIIKEARDITESEVMSQDKIIVIEEIAESPVEEIEKCNSATEVHDIEKPVETNGKSTLQMFEDNLSQDLFEVDDDDSGIRKDNKDVSEATVIKTTCVVIEIDEDSLFSDCSGHDEGNVFGDKDVANMKTLTPTNLDENITTNGAIVTEKNITMEIDAKSKDCTVVVDNIENGSVQDKDKLSASDKDSKEMIDQEVEDEVDLLVVDIQGGNTPGKESVSSQSQNTSCNEAKISHTGSTLEMHSIDIESEERRCSSDSDISSKQYASLIQDGCSSSSSVLSSSQSNISQDSKNIISLTDDCEAVYCSVAGEVEQSSHVEDSTNIVEGVNEEITEDGNNKAMISSSTADVVNVKIVNSVVSEICVVDDGENTKTVSVEMSTSGGGQVETTTVQDEDEIKIIEELSSVKGVRTSENSKADDRRIVDQLISDFEQNKPKMATLSSVKNTMLAHAVEMSGECWDVCEDADTPIDKNVSEKNDGTFNTNSLYQTSVLSIECEEANMSEEKQSSFVSPTEHVHIISQAELKTTSKKKKRSHDESVSISNKPADCNSEVVEIVSDSVTEVEMQLPYKKPKVLKPDFITDIISSVLSEFPLGGKTIKSSTPGAKSKPNIRGTVSKNSKQDDDDDVVIMDDIPAKSTSQSVITTSQKTSINLSHKTSVNSKRHTSASSSASVGKVTNPTSNSFQLKKRSSTQSYGFTNHSSHGSPSSAFQSQVLSINRRPSIISKNQTPFSARGKDPRSLTLVGSSSRTNITSPYGKINSSLPRLTPRVPIPSVLPNKTNESASAYLKHHAPGITTNTVPNRRVHFAASSHINSSATGRPDFKNKSYALSSSLSRYKVLTPSGLPPDSSRYRSGPTHNAGKFNSYPKHSPSSIQQNTERHKSRGLVQPRGIQGSSTQHSTSSSAATDSHNRRKALDGMEIVLGDSDEELNQEDSTGPRIVSVSSLSTLNTLNNSPNTSSHGPSLKGQKNVIVIPD